MTRPRGMTIAQLNGILDDMRKVYDFEDDKTYVTNMMDMLSESMNCIEITTYDAATGVHLTMQKGTERE